jgi:two-component system phosphate regulon sensor histidine kinase PhoR
MSVTNTYKSLESELEELRTQLHEANETIDAIRNGQVDALVVNNGKEHQLYTLRSADHTYRVFIEQMKEGAVTLNQDGIILYSNSQFASLLGASLTEVIGVPIIDFVPFKLHNAFKKIISEGWRSESKGEILFKNKNNKLIPFLLSVTSMELDEGKSLSVILTDLSIQKQNEKQLKLKNKQLEEAQMKVAKMNEELEYLIKERTKDLLVSREHFKFLADNIPVIVWTAYPDGFADYFNKQWYEYTGLSSRQSQGSGSQKALHPDDAERIIKAWQNAIKTQTAFQFEYRIKRAVDGEYRWHLGKGEPLKDESGNLVAWFGTATEIEDQKKELEKKDEFIGVASHELKTPLTSLKAYVQLIRLQNNLPASVNVYMKKVGQSIDKLQHLVNDLLDVSRINAGKLKFDTHIFDLSGLIKTSVDNCRHMYPSFNFTQVLEKNVIVRGNQERLDQVLMNLVSNAVKYSSENKEVIIKVEKDDKTATVSVTDFGIGLSTADQNKIFDRFFRVFKNEFDIPGLGMGLYISSEIIKEHHGTISVKSELHKGSVFSFTIPLAKTD